MTEEQKRKHIRKLQYEYIKANHKAYTFRFHKELDADIIEWFDNLDNRLGTIKKLFREEMEKEGSRCQGAESRCQGTESLDTEGGSK